MSALPDSLTRELGTLLSRLKLRRCLAVGDAPTVLGRVWIHGPGQVRLGHRVVLDGRMAPIELHAMQGGASLEALQSITVGAGARLGAFCKVMDNPHPPLQGNRHERPPSVPMVIEDGVTVGRRAIPTQDVPPDSLAMGNPVRNMGLERVARASGT